MAVLKKIKFHPDVINYFKKLPFFNTYIEKPNITEVKNIDLLSELLLYEELSVAQTDHTFKGYAMSNKVELIEKKDPLIQLEAIKANIKDLNDLLDKTKDFKYQITVKILLKKYKETETEFSPAYFNSTTKKVINHKFDSDQSFQEILYRIDDWINEGSGWIIESIKS